jgi:hypothetical protein
MVTTFTWVWFAISLLFAVVFFFLMMIESPLQRQQRNGMKLMAFAFTLMSLIPLYALFNGNKITIIVIAVAIMIAYLASLPKSQHTKKVHLLH